MSEKLSYYLSALPSATKDETAAKYMSAAKLAERAERFEDMCEAMSKLVQLKKQEQKDPSATCELEIEERNMLSVAYKNVVGKRRSSHRTLKSDPVEEIDEGIKSEYVALLESEIEKYCLEIVTIIQDSLLKAEFDAASAADTDTTLECQVFYLKMVGDYYRYLAEIKNSDSEADQKVREAAKNNYNAAIKMSKSMQPTHPTRLGLSLNASVCFYEILHDKKTACGMAKTAFDNAIQKLDSLNDANYKDSTLIMQLLRDNITLWNADAEENKGDGKGDQED